jgi:hypothetical protein
MQANYQAYISRWSFSLSTLNSKHKPKDDENYENIVELSNKNDNRTTMTKNATKKTQQ